MGHVQRGLRVRVVPERVRPQGEEGQTACRKKEGHTVARWIVNALITVARTYKLLSLGWR